MTREYALLKKVLSTIEVKEGLNKDNIVEEIQKELKEQDQGPYQEYQEWEKGKFDVNHVFSLYGKLTLLMIAAQNGHANVVEVLLKAEANVNAVDSEGLTPLHFAVGNGHASVVEVLLEKGAHVNAVNSKGYTPLHFAVGDGHASLVEVLLAKGANVNAVNSKGYTPLHFAFGNGRASVVEVLIKKGANVNAVDRDGKTPLDYAESQNVIKALLEAGGGSFLKARNKSGTFKKVCQTSFFLSLK